MLTHTFKITLANLSEVTKEVADRLFEAGCNDALLSSCNGEVTLTFDRVAPSMAIACSSAKRDVISAGFSIASIKV